MGDSMSGQLNSNAELKPNAQEVVIKAYIKACEALEVKSDVRVAMFGVDASTLTRNMERGVGNENKPRTPIAVCTPLSFFVCNCRW